MIDDNLLTCIGRSGNDFFFGYNATGVDVGTAFIYRFTKFIDRWEAYYEAV